MTKLGLIAGNGRFPFLLLDAARAHGLTVVVAAIKEETDPEITARAAHDPHIHIHWLSLGELSKLIDTFKAEGVTRATMAGQVKHKQIFSSIRPDWRLAKLLLNLRSRSTDMLLGAIAKVLADEGIELISSTQYLDPLLAKPGVLTTRAPDAHELADIAYGRTVARAIAAYDLGQTVVIAARACVAVEAMEGTDATVARAGDLFRTLDLPDPAQGPPHPERKQTHHEPEQSHPERDQTCHPEPEQTHPKRDQTCHPERSGKAAQPKDPLLYPSPNAATQTTLRRTLTVVKVAKPNQDMRFDVPVIGLRTIQTMREAGATCLAIEAGRTLLFDVDAIISAADAAQIAIVAE